MQMLKKIVLVLVVAAMATSCFSDRDDNGIFASEINDFIWKGMNAFYLYKDFKPDLANDRFTSNEEYGDYLNSFTTPQDIFDDLLYNPETVDEFSFLVDDYIALEQLLAGTTTSNGMEFGLRFVPGSSTDVIGYVRYVMPNTSAETQGVERGDIFYGVNGTPLDINNFSELLNSTATSYTINLATYDNNGTPEDTTDDIVTPGTESITLTKAPYTENPILTSSIIDVNGSNVGYLMYNGFTSSFDSQVNAVFGTFASASVTDLVIDLRYNGGGSVNSAIQLCSMITGQFNTEIFSKEEWNSDLQTYFEQNDPEALLNRFTNILSNGTPINSLNLTKVYVLTTGSSASASELVINSLLPYIDVVQIGTTTRGKYQASLTLYDSDNFGRQNANPNHTYALQPLVLKSLNKDDVTDYSDGLAPTTVLSEDLGNLGVLGNVTEPLLAEAILQIEGAGRMMQNTFDIPKLIADSNDFVPFGTDMYVDKELPIEALKSKLKNE